MVIRPTLRTGRLDERVADLEGGNPADEPDDVFFTVYPPRGVAA
jgi:hypothetical protein